MGTCVYQRSEVSLGLQFLLLCIVWTGGETRGVTVREISQEKWEAWGKASMGDKRWVKRV